MNAKAKLESAAEHCEDCRYFQEYEDLADLAEPTDEEDEDEEMLTGVCRRFPPTMLVAYPEPVTRHPDVMGGHDWCGEFTPS